MKSLVFILAVYLLALSIMSCVDSYNKNSNYTSTKGVVLKGDKQTDQNEICSPFCTCHCCNIPSYSTVENFAIKVNKPTINLLHGYYIQNFSISSNFHGNVWQPPRVTV